MKKVLLFLATLLLLQGLCACIKIEIINPQDPNEEEQNQPV